jgi:GDP/UDP-N,N'-diacetylbacillosamine 2-epimerase (hydrolysing)
MNKSAKRKICVVTGSRAEYGLLYWLMKEIANDPALELQTVVTGAHLSARFGSDVNTIANDFSIDAEVDMEVENDSAVGILQSLGKGIIGMGEALHRLRPDIVVVLGDRYEILGVAEACLISRIPLAHIHGGEITEGAYDDSIRHAITKMAQFHFTSAQENSNRILQMGESPQSVYTVGAMGLEGIQRLELLDREELEQQLSLTLGELSFAVTYHPVTLADQTPEALFRELLAALDRFPRAKIIFTKPNADAGNLVIGNLIDNFVAQNSGRAHAFASLGQLKYLSLISNVDAVIGNSSSGIIEAPSLGVPTVNIGDRQKGRLASESVIHCSDDSISIELAINKVISPDFRAFARTVKSPYEGKNMSKKIKDILKSTSLEDILRKKFYPIGSI